MYNIVIYNEDESFVKKVKNCISKIGISQLDVNYYELASKVKILHELSKINNIHILFLNSDRIDKLMLDTIKEYYPEMVIIQPKETNEDLTEYLRDVIDRIDTLLDVPCIVGHYRSDFIKVKLKNILYAKREKRGCRIFVNPYSKEYKFGSKILVDLSLEELLEHFEDKTYKFAIPYNGYIINLCHVNRISDNIVVLDTGEMLTISRSYHAEFENRFKSYYNKYKVKS